MKLIHIRKPDIKGFFTKVRNLKKEDAWIVVTNIYNPVADMKIPETMARGVENVILTMNEIIEKYAEEYDCQVVDLFHSDVHEHVQKDGLHPDQTGQQIIADAICGEQKTENQKSEN